MAVITCNGQPLESAKNQTNDSLDYLYDIYVYEDQDLDADNPSQYRECDDSEEDSNDENYAYNDYPDEDEVSDEVIDYYQYSDLNRDLSRNNIDSDYELSDEEQDPLKLYLKQKQLEESGEVDSDKSNSDEESSNWYVKNKSLNYFNLVAFHEVPSELVFKPVNAFCHQFDILFIT